MMTQLEAIKKWCKANPGKFLTQRTAQLELGIGRLSERMSIRELGAKRKVIKAWQTVKTRYGKVRCMGYRL